MKRKTIAELENVKGFVRSLAALTEVLMLTATYYLFWHAGYEKPAFSDGGKVVLAGVYALLTVLLYRNSDGFAFGNLRRLSLCVAQWISLLMVNVITYFQLCLIADGLIRPGHMLWLTAVQAIIIFLTVSACNVLYYRLYAPHTMLMIYGNDEAVTLKFKMDARRDKYRIEKLICVDVGLARVCQEIEKYDCVLINDVPARIRNDILKFCYRNGVRTYIVPKISDILMRNAYNITVLDTPIVMVRAAGLSLVDRFLKRTMDILLCLIVTVVALPVMLLTALAIKLEDGGPVFFKQKRATINGKEFDILKFRSMIVDAEREGFSIPATGEDPRITRVGKLIRATRIDELPQLLNILKGDMSIVGPRPERLEHVQAYSREIPEFEYRLKVKGGLTGYAQIYGKYNTTAYDKLRLDLMYIENYSILLDIKLILLTVRILLSKESTEGFEKREELELLKKETLEQATKEAGEEEMP